MAASAIPWDKIFRYGPLVVDTAGKALDRVMRWRSASVESGASAESKPQPENTLTLEQLSDAVSEQAKLTKQLAEQVSAVSRALSETSSKISVLESSHGAHAQFEAQTNESLDRIASEVSSLRRRSRVATAVAGVSVLLMCALAVVLALR